MRSLVISVIIIITALGITVFNTCRTCSVIDSIIADTEALTLDQGNIEHITQKWTKTEKILSLTSQRTYIREIDLALQNLNIALKAGDEVAFSSAKNTLIYNMKELRNFQAFVLEYVL